MARALIGAGGSGLDELEHETGRAFDVVGRSDVPREHFAVLAEGTLDEIGARRRPARRATSSTCRSSSRTAFAEADAVSRLSAGYEVQVIGGLPYVGTTQRLRIERATRFAAQAAPARRRAGAPGRAAAPPGRPSRTSTARSWTRSPTSSSRSAVSASGWMSRAACGARSAARRPRSAASAGARASKSGGGGGGGRGPAKAKVAVDADGESAADENAPLAAEDGEAAAKRRRRRGGRGRRGRGGSGGGNGARTPGENGAGEVVANGAPADVPAVAAAVSDRPPREPGAARPRQGQQRRRRSGSGGGANGAAGGGRAEREPAPAAAPESAPPRPAERAASTRDAAAVSEDERRKGLISRILER